MPFKIQSETIYSLSDVVDISGIGNQTLRKYINSGELKARKISGGWKITGRALLNFFESGNNTQGNEHNE